MKPLSIEDELVAEEGPAVIAQIDFRDSNKPSEDAISHIRKRGVAVVRGIIPEQEARGYKDGVEEEYVRAKTMDQRYSPRLFGIDSLASCSRCILIELILC